MYNGFIRIITTEFFSNEAILFGKTEYPRKDFTAIVSENAIPFADELRHTQSYLAVAKAQHNNVFPHITNNQR